MSLPQKFVDFAATARSRAPLYSRLSEGVAGSALLAEVFAEAPPPARVPVNLFAAVHYLLLAQPGAELAGHYPNLADVPRGGDPLPVFLAFCADHAEELKGLLAARLPQTSEIGRSALLLAGLGQRGSDPVGLLDVGASAGLNLLLDRFAYTDGQGHELGSADVRLACSVRGERPNASGPHGLADRLPVISARLGLDANPLDLTDPDDARWLEACVWPDQADRFERLRAAVELFGRDPVEVRRGDAVADLGQALADLDSAAPVVTTSWALCYLEPDRQRAFAAELDRLGASGDLAWVWVEAPERVPVLPVPPAMAGDPATLLGLTQWRNGVRTDRLLARCHHHGYWLNWY